MSEHVWYFANINTIEIANQREHKLLMLWYGLHAIYLGEL